MSERASPTKAKDSNTSDPWTECASRMKVYNEERLKAWKEEIDMLLVFAGLFSAVVTAFCAQSYQWLQPSPSTDATVLLLARISAQLGSLTVNDGFLNSTQPPMRPSEVESLQLQQIASSSIRINALWFGSLILSLTAASLCILVKQWLNEYSSGLDGISRNNARQRQFRDDGLRTWRVGNIIMLLPILLQIALMLFLAGLLILLWTLDASVATLATYFVAILAVSQIVSTLLPAFIPDCPYRSPQALTFFVLIQIWAAMIQRICKKFWSHKKYKDNHFWSLINQPCAYHWRERERELVAADVLSFNSLDERMLIAADLTFMDDHFLDSIIRPCLRSTNHLQAENGFRTILDNCSHQIVDHMGRRTILIRSRVILISIAVDVIELKLQQGHSRDMNPWILRFLVDNIAKTPFCSPQTLKRIHDVSVTLLDVYRGIRSEHCRLALCILCNILRFLTFNDIQITDIDSRTILSCVQWLIQKDGQDVLLIRVVQMLLQYTSTTQVESTTDRKDGRAMHSDILKVQCALFALWEDVPLKDHPIDDMLSLGLTMVRLSRRNLVIDAGLRETLIAFYMRYETANVLDGDLTKGLLSNVVSGLKELRRRERVTKQSPLMFTARSISFTPAPASPPAHISQPPSPIYIHPSLPPPTSEVQPSNAIWWGYARSLELEELYQSPHCSMETFIPESAASQPDYGCCKEGRQTPIPPSPVIHETFCPSDSSETTRELFYARQRLAQMLEHDPQHCLAQALENGIDNQVVEEAEDPHCCSFPSDINARSDAEDNSASDIGSDA